MKTIIMYRTAVYAGILAKQIKKRNSDEFRYINGIVINFNNGYHNTLGEETDTYSILEDVEKRN